MIQLNKDQVVRYWFVVGIDLAQKRPKRRPRAGLLLEGEALKVGLCIIIGIENSLICIRIILSKALTATL